MSQENAKFASLVSQDLEALYNVIHETLYNTNIVQPAGRRILFSRNLNENNPNAQPYPVEVVYDPKSGELVVGVDVFANQERHLAQLFQFNPCRFRKMDVEEQHRQEYVERICDTFDTICKAIVLAHDFEPEINMYHNARNVDNQITHYLQQTTATPPDQRPAEWSDKPIVAEIQYAAFRFDLENMTLNMVGVDPNSPDGFSMNPILGEDEGFAPLAYDTTLTDASRSRLLMDWFDKFLRIWAKGVDEQMSRTDDSVEVEHPDNENGHPDNDKVSV